MANDALAHALTPSTIRRQNEATIMLLTRDEVLAKLLGSPVDLIEEGTLKPRVQPTIALEAIRAF